MTGFARCDGAHGACTWHWEAKSVNNRGLDVRLRLPPGYDALEPKIREAVAKRFSRGSINIALTVDRTEGAAEIRLNETALAQVIAAADRLRQLTAGDAPSADALLTTRGVLEQVEPQESETETAARQAAMLKSLETALDGLAAARDAEGKRLKKVLNTAIDEIARLTGEVEASPARAPKAIASRLEEQVAKILSAGSGGAGQALDPQRLHQEAVLIATRADVEEELKRLHAHIEAARELLTAKGAVGRKLDFLAQEFNREANTLTAKAISSDVARAGLALKVVIDQIREQVQNIE